MARGLLTHLRRNAVAYLALFVALNSTAVAAVTLQRNAVLSRHIKNGQVKSSDIARNAVDSARVRNGTLLREDIKPGEVLTGPIGGAEILDGALTGADVDESTLAGVNAETLDGRDSGDFAASSHNHDAAYAASGHNHDTAYAAAGHNHDARYVNHGESNSVGESMILNTLRSVNIPLTSFVDCEGTDGSTIDFSEAADAEPDFDIHSTDGNGVYLRFDATAGSPDEDFDVCTAFGLPPDADGDGFLEVLLRKTVDTGVPTELLACRLLSDFQDADTANLPAAGPGLVPVRCEVSGSGGSVGRNAWVGFSIEAPSGTMNDAVEVWGVRWVYEAGQ